MDDCESLGPRGFGDWAFLRSLQGLTSLSWANRFGGPSWFASEAELDDLPRVFGLVQQTTALTNLQRWACACHGCDKASDWNSDRVCREYSISCSLD